MSDITVFVLSCPSGVLGVYRSRKLANKARAEYISFGYMGLKIDSFTV